MLLGVLGSHVLLSTVGSGGVHSCTLSLAITASRLKGTKLAPLNPPKILLLVIKASKAALKHSKNSSLVMQVILLRIMRSAWRL